MHIPRTMMAAPSWIAAQDLAQWLTAGERTLCDGATSARRRDDRRAGRMAAKRLLQEAFGADPLAYAIGSDGVAPTLAGWPGPPGLTISLSHSAGMGAAAWAWMKEGAVGVDAQHIRPAHPGLAARVLTAAERAQAARVPGGAGVLLFWALKEAAIKARRRPWGRALAEAVVTLDGPDEEEGVARVAVAGGQTLTSQYARQREPGGEWWVARALLPE